MKTGNIGVTTENIFPVIKKFLYSDHEIFLREIISNAVDATQKLKTLAGKGDFQGELGELKVSVAIDKDAKTITVSDRGIGMTADEIEITDDGLEAVVDLCSGTSGIRDVEQVAEHLAANALYRIEAEGVKKVSYDAKAIHDLID